MSLATPHLTDEYDGEICTLTYRKGKETYVFRFADAYREEMLRVLGRFASNQNLNFTWYDAIKVSPSIPKKPMLVEDILSGRSIVMQTKRP